LSARRSSPHGRAGVSPRRSAWRRSGAPGSRGLVPLDRPSVRSATARLASRSGRKGVARACQAEHRGSGVRGLLRSTVEAGPRPSSRLAPPESVAHQGVGRISA
jgi:hypothetical protein